MLEVRHAPTGACAPAKVTVRALSFGPSDGSLNHDFASSMTNLVDSLNSESSWKISNVENSTRLKNNIPTISSARTLWSQQADAPKVLAGRFMFTPSIVTSVSDTGILNGRANGLRQGSVDFVNRTLTLARQLDSLKNLPIQAIIDSANGSVSPFSGLDEPL